MRAVDLKETLSKYRFDISTEDSLQRGIAEVLTGKVEFRREARLNSHDRPDFVVGTVAVEVKIGGSSAALTRQIGRYAELPEVEELLVITTRSAHQVPAEIHGKRVTTLVLRGGLW